MRTLLNIIRRSYSANTNQGITSEKLGSLEGILIKKRKQQRQGIEQYKRNLPFQQTQKFMNDHLAAVTLYMRHDCWTSQYIYSLMNYNKMGFKRVSDLQYLDSTSYHLNLRAIADEERWPLLRLQVGLQPTVIVRGIKQIQQYLYDNQLFERAIVQQSPQIEVINKVIDDTILVHLQRIFWHPSLTFQYSFHTNRSSYDKGIKNYTIFGIMRRNFTNIMKRVIKNLISIYKYRKQYLESKLKLKEGLKSIQVILQNKEYFGGKEPNYTDFYLFSHIKTKESSKHFLLFLQQQIGGKIWKWWVRMSILARFNPDRMTFL